MKLKDIADKIKTHLKKWEADPSINTKTRGLSRFFCPWAHASGNRVGVCYVSFQGTTYLTKSEALTYLSALDEGFIGTHWQFERKAKAASANTTQDTQARQARPACEP